MEDLDQMLRVTTKEAIQYGCTWSISKFYAARLCRVFRVVLDPSGLNPPSMGPDLERVQQLS